MYGTYVHGGRGLGSVVPSQIDKHMYHIRTYVHGEGGVGTVVHSHTNKRTYSQTSLRHNLGDLRTKLALVVTNLSNQDMILHAQYYSRPNRVRKPVYAKQNLS